MSHLESHIQLLRHLTKLVIADRYKRMAKDEVLSKFIHAHVDPVLLVDINLQVERESIALTEMSLLSLVTSERMSNELRRTAEKIQKSFDEIYGEESGIIESFASPELIHLRSDCLRSRVEFYNPFLSVQDACETPFQLAERAYNEAERFQKKLEAVIRADKAYNDELVRETIQMHRFLMRKQADYEVLKSEELWLEFKSEAFKKPQALA